MRRRARFLYATHQCCCDRNIRPSGSPWPHRFCAICECFGRPSRPPSLRRDWVRHRSHPPGVRHFCSGVDPLEDGSPQSRGAYSNLLYPHRVLCADCLLGGGTHPSWSRLARSEQLALPRVRLAATQRAFSYRAATSWNALPSTVTQCSSNKQFKTKLREMYRGARV